jgi:hypothetical protein
MAIIPNRMVPKLIHQNSTAEIQPPEIYNRPSIACLSSDAKLSYRSDGYRLYISDFDPATTATIITVT